MKAKKVYIFIILALFIVALFSCTYFLFKISKIDISFAINENTDVSEITDNLEDFKDKNLLFFDLEEVEETVKKYDYFELISVKKVFPATIKVEIKERRETYSLQTEDSVYILSQNGYVFNAYDKENYTKDESLNLIELKFSGIFVTSSSAKSFIDTDNQDFITLVFKMTESIELSDCIKEVKVVNAVEKQDVVFITKTGVTLVVFEALDDGLKKIEKQFERYEGLSDLEKSYGSIYITKNEQTGEIGATWSPREYEG